MEIISSNFIEKVLTDEVLVLKVLPSGMRVNTLLRAAEWQYH